MIVYKFPLTTGKSTMGVPEMRQQEIRMPEDAKILSLGMQNGNPVIWAACGTEPILPSNKPRHFITIGTGITLPDHPGSWKLEFIGTFQMDWFVGHVFEMISQDK